METLYCVALCLGLGVSLCAGWSLRGTRDRRKWAAYVETLPTLDDFWEEYEGDNHA